MKTLAKAGLGDVYNHIMRNAHLDEYVVVNNSPSLKAISFVEIDASTCEYVMPLINDMVDKNRERARFMLDVCTINLLRNGKDLDSARVTAIDVHFSTLMRTDFRTRYLVILADFLRNSNQQILLNIKLVPVNTPSTRMGDLLRYLIPILKNVSIQVSQENILSQDLIKLSANYFVLSVRDLTKINASMRRDITLERLSRLAKHGKEIIVRNVTDISVKSDLAYYL
jgi:hypothetical protein